MTATLAAGERIEAEPGAIVARSATVTSDATTGGTGATGTTKSAFSDEQEVLETQEHGSTVTVGLDLPGNIARVDLSARGRVKVQSGGIVAWTPVVEKSTAANEASNFFSSGELTVLALDGDGVAFLSAFGGLRRHDVASDDPLVVDEDHLLAWTDGLDVSRTKDSSIESSLLGGEGFVTRFEGDGTVWLQTRDLLVLRDN